LPLPGSSSSLISERPDHDGDQEGDNGNNGNNGNNDNVHDGDEYWTGVNPAVPPLSTTAGASNNSINRDNTGNSHMSAVMAVARHNHTHEQVILHEPHHEGTHPNPFLN